MNKPLVSIAIPYYAKMKNAEFFMDRCLESIRSQTFQDYEIVITRRGKMAENTNNAIMKCTGELIKVLFMDDYFAHKNALKDIVDNFKEKDDWMITGCDTNPHPQWTDDILKGNNKLGSPSCLTFRNLPHKILYFDENLSWLLDCDLYHKWHQQSGKPKILDSINIKMGIGDHQHTNVLTDKEKLDEQIYLDQEYA